MEIELKNLEGQSLGQIEVSESLFGTRFNPSLVHQAMVMYQLNRRQGTHKVKVRSEVSGGGAKPWRQKHTGRARHGSNRSPIWRHGGITFGPSPRSYRRDMPKRMRNLALRCVLSQKLKTSKIVLVEGFDGLTGKTKEMIKVLNALQITGSTLIVTCDSERNVVKSAHNLPRVWTLPVGLLNAEELLKRANLLLTLDALRKAEAMWGQRKQEEINGSPSELRAAGPDEVVNEAVVRDGTTDTVVEPDKELKPSTATTRTRKPSTATTRTRKPSTATTRTRKPSTATTRTRKPSTATTRTRKPSTATTRTRKPEDESQS